MPDLGKILTVKYPEAAWSLENNDYGTLVWEGPGDKPTLAELELHWPPVAVVSKKGALAAYRYEKEVGGLTMPNGMRVATDDRSKSLITGARLDTMADPTILTDWKADTGWIQINADTVAMIATAVAAHVRACFTAERAHCATIDALAADPAEIEAYDITTGWPV